MPKENIDYSNTIIYKIYCNDDTITDIYVIKLIPKSNLGFEKWTFINVQNEKAGKSFENPFSKKTI